MFETPNQVDSLTQMEWQGKFSASAAFGAQFALYLAMQATSATDTLHINPIATHSEPDNYPERINFYRKPALTASDTDYTLLKLKHATLAKGDYIQLRLLDCLHPSPLAGAVSKHGIPSEVFNNMPLRARLSLEGQHNAPLQEDNTLLHDSIERALRG